MPKVRRRGSCDWIFLDIFFEQNRCKVPHCQCLVPSLLKRGGVVQKDKCSFSSILQDVVRWQTARWLSFSFRNKLRHKTMTKRPFGNLLFVVNCKRLTFLSWNCLGECNLQSICIIQRWMHWKIVKKGDWGQMLWGKFSVESYFQNIVFW